MIQGGSLLAGISARKKNMRKGHGFTIIEVLIVLAVSSAMFVIVAILISGRQNRTEFQTAINNTTQSIQQLINETASGYFPSSNGSFACTVNGDGTLSVTGGSAQQGTNQGCIFLGKVAQFSQQLNGGQNFDVYPVAGNQAASQVIGPVLSNGSSGAQPTIVPSLKQSQTLMYGLNVYSMSYVPAGGGASVKTGGMAFLAGAGANGVFSTQQGSGLAPDSQQQGLYAVVGTTVSTSSGQFQTALQPPAGNNGQNFVQASQVIICFASAGTNQSGAVTIGSSGGFGVTLHISEGNTTCS